MSAARARGRRKCHARLALLVLALGPTRAAMLCLHWRALYAWRLASLPVIIEAPVWCCWRSSSWGSD